MNRVFSKNAVWRVVISLICIVVITFAFFSKIAARFTSDDNSNPSAEIADWNFTISIDGSKMFSEYYADGVYAEAGKEDDEYDVRAVADSTAITPDTSGYIVVNITGNAETDARVILEATGSDIKVEHSGDTYEPLLWSFDIIENGIVTNIKENVSLVQVVTAVNNVDTVIKASDAETDLSYVISWNWPLSSGNDEYDSLIAKHAMGKSIGGEYNVKSSINFSIDVSVEQVD